MFGDRTLIPDNVSGEINCGFRIMTSSFWEIVIFLCPSLSDWSRQASIKAERIMKVNIQMFLPGFRYTAALQLQSAHRYDDRAGDSQNYSIWSTSPDTITCLSKLQTLPEAAKNIQEFFWVAGQGLTSHSGSMLWRWCVQWQLSGWKAISVSTREMRDMIIVSRLLWFVASYTQGILEINFIPLLLC